MKQEELRQQYNVLKTALDQGDITEKSFQESVNQLRYEDKHRVWHQLDAQSGAWLCWEVDHWAPQSQPVKTKKFTNSVNQDTRQQDPLPQSFWALLKLILKNTMKMFFEKLPSTLLFMFLALVLHTFLLLNGGISPYTFTGKFLSLSFDLSSGASPLSGIIVWTIVPMLAVNLFTRMKGKNTSLGLALPLSTVKNYFRDAREDATVVTLGSLGVALIVGTLINGYSSLVMAAGVGTLIASKSGSIIALLFRSAWTSVFDTARKDNIARYGLAIGYVTMFASSIALMVNFLLVPYGATVGVLLLIVALVMAKGSKISPAMVPILIPGLVIFGSAFLGLDLLWADFISPPLMGHPYRCTVATAIPMGIVPALGAGFGLLVQGVLRNMADNFPSDLDTTTSAKNQYGTDNILDGGKATRWMSDHDYLDENGQATERFHNFMDALPSESGPGLQGFTGKLDEKGNPTGRFTIIRDGTPVPQKKPNPIPVPPVQPVKPVVPSKQPPIQSVKPPVQPVNPVVPSKQPPIQPVKPPPINYSNVERHLKDLMNNVTKKQKNAGYFVRNSKSGQRFFEYWNKKTPIDLKIFNAHLFTTGFDSGIKALNNFGELPKHLNKDWSFHPIDRLFDWKGGQCGDYAEWGAKWSKKKIWEQYGRGAKFNKIIVTSNTYSDWNHAATRVKLLNGEIYILDYWEGMQTDKPAIYKEDEWIKKYKKDFNYLNQGSEINYKIADSVDSEQDDADKLKSFIKKLGPEIGKKIFLRYHRKRKQSKYAQLIVSDWEKRPW